MISAILGSAIMVFGGLCVLEVTTVVTNRWGHTHYASTRQRRRLWLQLTGCGLLALPLGALMVTDASRVPPGIFIIGLAIGYVAFKRFNRRLTRHIG